MAKNEVVEVCPQCGEEISMEWDTELYGLNAFCPYCGEQILLCDECLHRDEYKSNCAKCNYKQDCSGRRYEYVTDGDPAYDVEITEVLKKTVSVNAVTKAQAVEIATQRYENGDYILDESSLASRSIAVTQRLAIPAE